MARNQRRYFSHDDDALFDSKIVKMRAKLGLAGYGAYWATVETLRRAKDYRYEADYDVLACICNEPPELFRAVIEDFDLFEFEEIDGVLHFYSPSLDKRMERMEAQIEQKRIAGRLGAQKRWQSDGTAIAPLKHRHSVGNGDATKNDSTKMPTKLNETKVNKTKEISTEPSKDASMQEPVFIKLPLNDGTEHIVTEKDLQRYAELYPAVDVKQDLRNMVGWLEANPSKRKTKNGVRRFITNWLARTQDGGGTKGNNKPAAPNHTWNGKPDNRYFVEGHTSIVMTPEMKAMRDAFREWLIPQINKHQEEMGRLLTNEDKNQFAALHEDEFREIYKKQTGKDVRF